MNPEPAQPHRFQLGTHRGRTRSQPAAAFRQIVGQKCCPRLAADH